MGELAKDFVQRVAQTLSGKDLSPPDENISSPEEKKATLYQDYEEMDFGDVLDFGLQTPKALKKTKQKVAATKEKLAAKVEAKRKQLQHEAQKPMNIRLQDKISFTAGIVNICLTVFLLGYSPSQFHWVYTVKFPLLVGLRYYIYHKSKWHYFLLDFCYFANLLFFLYLHVWPDNCFLFKLSFAFTSGPLSWAIALWKNSMVFHSLDKITSLFIHLTPSLVVWAIKWFPSDFNTCQAEGGVISWTDAVVYPSLVYCFWQLLYYIKVEIYDRHKFKNDKDYMTSFLWLTSEKQNRSLIYKLSNMYGKKYQMWWFGVWQLVYTILTLLPVKLFYQSLVAHTTFLIAMCIISSWNGACFYIEVFSVRYHQSIIECEKHYEKLSNILNAGDQKQAREKQN